MKDRALYLGHYPASALWPSAFDPRPLTLSDPALSGHKPRARFAHAALLAASVSLALLPFVAGQAQAATSVITFTSSGNWTCPVGVTSVQVECWGGGGAGGSAVNGLCVGGGGAGDAYVRSTPSVSSETTYAVTVGSGGTANTTVPGYGGTGGDSWFSDSSTIKAQGGAGGQNVNTASALGTGGVGSSASSIGTTKYRGGDGWTPISTTASGGGGGSGGTGSDGTSATSYTGAAAVNGGGAGGNGSTGTHDGYVGSAPGGGGGGARAGASTTQRTGGAGVAGQVVLTYTTPTYYSESSGDANTLANWNTARDGSSGNAPGNFMAGGIFVIQNGHSMITSAAWTLGQDNRIQIENGGMLTTTFLLTTANFQVDNGGTYVHDAAGSSSNGNASDFPGTTRMLGATSTVEFQQWAGAGISPAALPSGISWGNVIINVGTLAGAWSQAGNVTTINGSLTIKATGGKEFRMSSTVPYTATIAGDLIIQGGTFSVAGDNLSASGTTINLRGSLTQSGGTFIMYGNTGASADFIFNSAGGPVSVTYSKGTGTFTPGTKLNFIVSAGKTLTLNDDLAATGPSRTMAVNGTLNCGSKNVTGDAKFTLASGATLGIGSAAGISSTAGQGNIQATGTRTYAAGANYVYNGAAAQVTGDQLPATVNNLTIANTAGAVSLSGSEAVNGTLTVNSGANLDFNGHTVAVATAPVLNGALTMEVSKTGANTFTGSKLAQSTGKLTYGGTLTVTETGSALQTGDTIPLFSAINASYGGGFTSVTGPTPSGLTRNDTQLTGGTGGNITFSCDGSLSASAGPGQTICSGGSGVAIGGSPTASGGGSGSYTYSWSPSTGLSSSTAANPTASPATTTLYTVMVTDSVGCTASSQVTVTVNPLPTAATDTYNRAPGLSLKINKNDLLANDTVGSTFANVNLTTAHSVTLEQNDTTILYPANAASQDDSFTYTITGLNGCTGIGTVNIQMLTSVTGGQVQTINVTGNSVTLNFIGVPDYSYQVQRATTLSGSGDWTDVGSPITAPSSDPAPGVFNYTDTFTGKPPPTAYYRLKYVGVAP